MGDLDLLFEFEGEDHEEEDDDVRRDFRPNYCCCANYNDGGYENFWNVQLNGLIICSEQFVHCLIFVISRQLNFEI
uniref:Uncharacterized protein n=1 Tax=Romanomermis culicivorax TaxID=13658 RepID=A0A915JQR0_ROMCU